MNVVVDYLPKKFLMAFLSLQKKRHVYGEANNSNSGITSNASVWWCSWYVCVFSIFTANLSEQKMHSC